MIPAATKISKSFLKRRLKNLFHKSHHDILQLFLTKVNTPKKDLEHPIGIGN